MRDIAPECLRFQGEARTMQTNRNRQSGHRLAGYRLATLAGAAAIAALVTAQAMAQAYPTKPITAIDGLTGGALEALKRTVLAKIKDNTGTTVIFEGRPGGGGAPALQALKIAAPDGYTFGIAYQSALTLNPVMNPELNIDPIADFIPVTRFWASFNIWGAKLDSPYKDIRDLVAAAKAKPDSVKVGIFGAGNRFFVAQLEEKTGARFLQIPFKSLSDGMTAVLGGHIDTVFDSPTSAASYKGRAKVVLYAGAPVPPALTGAVNSRELYGIDSGSWVGALAPAKTPDAAVKWLERELARALADPKIVQTIADLSLSQVTLGATEFGNLIRNEVTENRALVKKYPDIR